MLVRLGYVAMSVLVKNASPSKTMTYTSFSKLDNRDAALRKLERIAEENLHNTLRLLRHNRAHDIEMYRCSSRLIPLLGHEDLADWDPMERLADAFGEIGQYAREHRMRISFHPDHFTVLSTPRSEVLANSYADLQRHVRMLEAMGMDESATCNIHIGGTYGNKAAARERFVRHFGELNDAIKRRLTLENDDKTFNARETLEVCEELGVPMVLDLHHHQVNNEGESAEELWPRILATWEGRREQARADGKQEALPPKIHISSPKNEKDVRSHADYIDIVPLMRFLRAIAPVTSRLDMMLEAKMKDEALLRLMEEMKEQDDVRIASQASFELR